jgi:lipoic acid synthetase
MGDQCTRNCKFCAVKHNVEPLPLESSEPQRVAEAAKEMGLEYVVVTSVTRDDLPDGGAGHFAAVIRALKDTVPGIGVEVLTPDFNADFQAIETVLKEKPSVFNHNVETVERLAEQIRNRANYRRSLKVLSMAAELGGNDIPAKSGLMVGLGETDGEVETTICDLKDHGVSILTIGQYLPPTSSHWPLDRYVEPDKFNYWKEFALSKGFLYVASAPLVRSSYNAAEAIKRCGSD